jgi:HSP20 family protein
MSKGKDETVKMVVCADFLLREYGVGDNCRTFRISEQIDPSRISAELPDGVPTLHLPKAETAKPRKIKVEMK